MPAGPWRTNGADGRDWTDHADAYPLAAAGLTFTDTAGGFVLTRSEGSAPGYTINATGVLLLELANGRYSLAEITEVVARTFALSDTPDSEIRSVDKTAARHGLVRDAVDGDEGGGNG